MQDFQRPPFELRPSDFRSTALSSLPSGLQETPLTASDYAVGAGGGGHPGVEMGMAPLLFPSSRILKQQMIRES